MYLSSNVIVTFFKQDKKFSETNTDFSIRPQAGGLWYLSIELYVPLRLIVDIFLVQNFTIWRL